VSANKSNEQNMKKGIAGEVATVLRTKPYLLLPPN
jgi:hypothetical protein